MTAIVLKPGKQRRIENGHVWVFAGEVQQLPPEDCNGTILPVQDSRGRFLGQGYVNTRSNILARLLTRAPEPVDASFWRRALERAIAYRERFVRGTDAFRLVFGEADGLPALIVDCYHDTLVVQSLALGIDAHLNLIADLLVELLRPRSVYERSDVAIRQLEGLEQRSGLLRGEEPPAEIPVSESGLQFLVDIRQGQKTGFFLDQRLNRASVAALAAGRRVLDAFCYTGAFSIATARGGAAEVLGIEVSGEALKVAQRQAELNGVGEKCRWLEGNAFDHLRRLVAEKQAFDLAILDPPAFTKNKDSIPGALRGYKEINLRALKLLSPGGLLVTCSCSHHVDPTLFQQVVQEAAQDARRHLRLVEARGQAPDHPILLSVPETNYLKCLILEVD